MIDSIILAQFFIIFLQYFAAAAFFWYFKFSIIDLLKVIDAAIKSPRNRKNLESHIKTLQKSKKNSLIWPIEIVLSIKDEIKK